MSRRSRFLVLFLALGATTACGSATAPEGPDGGDPGGGTGSMQISLTGLASGVGGSLTVTGPSGFSRTVTSSSSLTGLTPGSYTVAAAGVTGAGIAYEPSQSSQTVAVTADASTTVVVDYVAQLGGIVLTILGVPGGSAASIDVTGPNGYSETVSSSTTLAALPVGVYTVTANAITAGADMYEADPASATVSVVFNQAPETVITYQIAAASLAVTVSGLPGGTNADVQVDGPGGYSQAVTATTTLTGLVAGVYTITAATVSGGGGTFTPTQTSQSVTVAGGASETATVSYGSLALRADYQRLSGGKLHTCALDAEGDVWCWGNANAGQLGTGLDVDTRLSPLQVAAGPYEQVAAGGEFTCARRTGGSVDCWGQNFDGETGTGSPMGGGSADILSPTPVSGGHAFTEIAASQEGSHACGIDTTGAAWCWGRNDNGQLGDGSQTNRNEPVAVSGGHTFTDLFLTGQNTCALDDAGSVWCWGLGLGSTTPAQVPGGLTFAALGSGGAPCALTAGGRVYCWGMDFYLGVSGPDPEEMAAGRVFVQLVTGISYACGLEAGGAAWCWGWNTNGVLGDGTFDTRTTAAMVTGGHAFVDLAPGPRHMCGIDGGGVRRCWGNNYDGQLGVGTQFTTEPTPLEIGSFN